MLSLQGQSARSGRPGLAWLSRSWLDRGRRSSSLFLSLISRAWLGDIGNNALLLLLLVLCKLGLLLLLLLLRETSWPDCIVKIGPVVVVAAAAAAIVMCSCTNRQTGEEDGAY